MHYPTNNEIPFGSVYLFYILTNFNAAKYNFMNQTDCEIIILNRVFQIFAQIFYFSLTVHRKFMKFPEGKLKKKVSKDAQANSVYLYFQK